MKEFHNHVEANAERTPNKIAVTVNGREISYRALNELACRVAHYLAATGMKVNDRVSLHAPTSIEAIACALGVMKAGFVLVLMHYGIAAEKLIHQLNDVKTKTLIVPSCTNLEELASKAQLQFILCMDDWHTHHFAGFNCMYSECDGGLHGAAVRVIFHTSGSTNDSKGVAVSDDIMIAANKAISKYLGSFEEAVILNFSPLHFDYGFYNIMLPLLAGGHSVTESALPEHPGQMLYLIERYGVTGMHILPPSIHYLLQAPPEAFRHGKTQSLRYISSSGQALPPKHIQQLRVRLPNVLVYSMYGLTECKRVAYLSPEQLDRRPNSVGKEVLGVRTYLVDEAGQLVTKPDCVGELVVAGDLLMLGYWDKPELTKQVIKHDMFGETRVYFTGDLFRRDAENFLYFVGRKDRVFTRRSFQVNPREIEYVIDTHEAVSEVLVVPFPDEVAGQVPKACVVLKEGHELSADELLRYCGTYLDWYMVPAMVSFHKALPMNLNGKTTASLLMGGAVAN